MNKCTILRTLLALGMTGTALLTQAQPTQGVPRIGVLDPSPSDTSSPRLNGLRAGLKSRGLEEGRDYLIEYRSAEGKFERLPALAAAITMGIEDVAVRKACAGAVP